MSFFPTFVYRFNAIPIQTPVSYFVDICKYFLKFIMQRSRSRIANIVLKKGEVGGFTSLDFKNYNKSTIIKTVCLWKKNRYIDQLNRIEPRSRPTQI